MNAEAKAEPKLKMKCRACKRFKVVTDMVYGVPDRQPTMPKEHYCRRCGIILNVQDFDPFEKRGSPFG